MPPAPMPRPAAPRMPYGPPDLRPPAAMPTMPAAPMPNAAIGATPPPTMPPAPMPGAQPAAAASPNGMPPAPMPAAQPPNRSQEYADLLKQEPQRDQFQADKLPLWKKALGLAFAGMGGFGTHDGTTYKLAQQVLSGPQDAADQKFNDAENAWKNKVGAVSTEAGLDEKGAATQKDVALGDEASARADSLRNPPDKPQKESSPEQQAFDALIKSGKSAPDAYEQIRMAGKADPTPKDKTPQQQAFDAYRAGGMTPQQAYEKIREKPPSLNPGSNANDPKDIADGIERGELPPTVKGLYRNSSPVLAELSRRGYDLAKSESDWNATQKHLATMNGAQQERLRQAVSFTKDSLGMIEDLYGQWKKVGPNSGVKLFNRAGLEAAKQLPGEAGSVATRLEAQINDLTSELGTVYKGGNSSTDESLKLAAGNLKGEWNEQTFGAAVKQIRQNLQIRENSIKNSRAAGVSDDSPYTPDSEKGGSATSPFDQWKAGKKP